jgi:eukaryotic-like serine/threonine-protein kinase
MIGRRLAHYEIVAKLGEGGMGLVFKARDHHLDRFVALKLLRADKASDPDRRRRFIIEAKAASSLNHPNIITIYDIDHADDLDFIAMEYVKGQTLRSLAGRRRLPVADVLKYGIQIADAVSAAHAAGIVHRDLKPDNVMISDQGVAKVLDFGLAKLTEATPLAESEATRTLQQAGTEEGQILGTVAYMAPEQVEGKKIDARTDVFAFGAMLYEMLTGRRAFERDSRMGTLSAILKDSPPPVSVLVGETPPELDRVVVRCLRKEPDRRYQTMLDVKNALDELKEDSETGGLPSRSFHQVGSRKRMPVWWVGVPLLAVGIAGAWWWKARFAERPKELSMRPLTADSGLTTDPVLSRDGKLVAYASDRATQKNLDIWVHPLTEGAQPIRLTRNDADNDSPDFSPDGGLIAFHSNREGGGIYLVPALGGEERLLVRGGRFPRFSPDGKWIVYCMSSSGTAYLEQSRIYMVPVTGGTVKQLATDVPWAYLPLFSGDGKHILFEGADAVNDPVAHDWWVTPVAGGQSVRTGAFAALAEQNLRVFGVPTDWVGDRVLFTANGQIWGLHLSIPGWKASARARQLTSGSNTASRARAGGPSQLVFNNAQLSRHLWRLRLDSRTGKALGEMEPLPHSGGSQYQPSSSADGRLLAYTQSEPSGTYIRLRDLRAGKEITLVSVSGRPKVSPDGSHVAYSVFPAGVYLMSSSGGESTLLIPPQGKFSTQIYAWTPDGKRIVYWWGEPIRYGLLDPQTRQSTELIAHSKYNIHGAELSPDEHWVAFNTPRSAREKPLWIAAYRNGKAADEKEWILVSRDGDVRPWWSPDGNLLYMVSQRDGAQCIWAQRLDPATKRPVGEAFAVYHIHGARVKVTSSGLAFFGPAILPDSIIFGLDEETGNVWIGDQKE